MNKIFSGFFELLKIVVVALIIVIPVRYFLFQPFFVKGASMEPAFDDGQYLIIDEISWRLREPQRGEVAVFKYPNDPKQYFIKRIIGLPGETVIIDNGTVTIEEANQGKTFMLSEKYLAPWQTTDGKMTITVGADNYFVMGDNRVASYDSRRFGTVNKKYLVGRTWLRAWPPGAFQIFNTPQYLIN